MKMKKTSSSILNFPSFIFASISALVHRPLQKIALMWFTSLT
jgi:hypothetical protein